MTVSNASVLLIASCAVLVGGCEPTVVVGARMCAQSLGDGSPMPNPGVDASVPWRTGFEDGFCDYALPMGFCFGTGAGTYALVTSPVHSGRYAAAFSVRTEVEGGSQVRCVQQGVFPTAAYYGAWYYLPNAAQNTRNWNLIHFQGGDAGEMLHNVWDLSLVNRVDGGLRLNLLDYIGDASADAAGIPPMPIEQWVHLELYFRRAKDMTGELSVWQDGALVGRLTGVATDDSDWGQWYVGNLATALTPPDSTVYVDDVEMSFTR